jgi:F-type H+-transporting ATPase subunit alpha
MQIRPEEIASVLRKEIESFDYSLEMAEVGTVLEVGDGIARIYGLDNVMANEMLEFPNGSFGMAFNLEEDNVGAVILGDGPRDQGGSRASSAPGACSRVPVGEALLGRVVNPLGEPLDGRGPIETKEFRYVESPAPRASPIASPSVSRSDRASSRSTR